MRTVLIALRNIHPAYKRKDSDDNFIEGKQQLIMKSPLQLVFHSSVSRSVHYNPGTPSGFIHDLTFMKATWAELPFATVCVQYVAGQDYVIWQWNMKMAKPLDCFIEAQEGSILLIQPVQADDVSLVIGAETVRLFPKIYCFLYLPTGMHPFRLNGATAFFIFIQPPLSFLTGLRSELNGLDELINSSLKQHPHLIRLPVMPVMEDSWMRLKRLDAPALKNGIPDLLLRKYMIDVLHDFGKQSKMETRSELLFTGTKQKSILLRQLICKEPLDDSLGSLDEIAKKFYADPRSLNRSFQQLTGKTILQFILEEKLKHAEHLVMHTTIPIVEIVFRCGFNDVSHFIRSFRKRFGTTPGRMRRGI
jgi:AraC-like DNA-binding protein